MHNSQRESTIVRGVECILRMMAFILVFVSGALCKGCSVSA